MATFSRRRKIGDPINGGREQLGIRRWSQVLNVPLMKLRYAVATSPDLETLRGREHLTAVEARRIAAVAARISGP